MPSLSIKMTFWLVPSFGFSSGLVAGGFCLRKLFQKLFTGGICHLKGVVPDLSVSLQTLDIPLYFVRGKLKKCATSALKSKIARTFCNIS